jgi:hypothetical protein
MGYPSFNTEAMTPINKVTNQDYQQLRATEFSAKPT